jgi:hypothetical protein
MGNMNMKVRKEINRWAETTLSMLGRLFTFLLGYAHVVHAVKRND